MPQYEAGEIVLPNFAANSLESIFGMDMEYLANEGDVEFNASNDDGSTWLYWDGGGWVSSAGWNSWQEVDENLDTFPFSTQKKQCRLKAKLSPDISGTQRPFLHRLRLFCDYKYKMTEDCLRTFKHYIEDNACILNREECIVDTATYHDLSDLTTVIDDNEIRVYNETVDPAHTIDLFDHYELVGEKQRIHFNTAQTGRLHIVFHCKVPVHIATSEVYQTVDNPAYVLTTTSWPEMKALRSFDDEWLYKFKERKALKKRKPVWYTVAVQISAHAPLKRLALVMGNAIDDIFQWGGKVCGDTTTAVYSEASGQHFPIIEFSNMTPADEIGRGVFVMVGGLLSRVREWKGCYEEVPLAEEIHTHIGSFQERFRTIVEKTYCYCEDP